MTVSTAAGVKSITGKEQLPQQRFALESVKQHGGTPWSDQDWEVFDEIKGVRFLQFGGVPIPAARFSKLQGLRSLRHASFGGCEFTDEAMLLFSEHQNLRYLSLEGNLGVTDVACDILGTLPALRDLAISRTNITAAGLKEIANNPGLYSLSLDIKNGITARDLPVLKSLESLKVLHIRAGEINDDLVESLAKLNSLRVIGLMHTTEGKAEVARLQKLLPNCLILHPSLPISQIDKTAVKWADNLNGSVTYHGANGEQLAVRTLLATTTDEPSSDLANLKGPRGLEELGIRNVLSVDKQLVFIKDISTLRKIALSGSDVSVSGIEQLKNLDQLEIVTLQSEKMTDDALQHFSALKSLWYLSLNGVPMTGQGLIHLGKIPSLQELSFGYCPNLTNDGLDHLVALPNLRSLNLDHTTITDGAIVHLQQMKSLRTLYLTGTNMTPAGISKLHCLSAWSSMNR